MWAAKHRSMLFSSGQNRLFCFVCVYEQNVVQSRFHEHCSNLFIFYCVYIDMLLHSENLLLTMSFRDSLDNLMIELTGLLTANYSTNFKCAFRFYTSLLRVGTRSTISHTCSESKD